LTSDLIDVANHISGFHDIVPAELISIFNEQELELLISGLPDIDVDDWKNNTEYHNYSASSPQMQWFWRAVRSFDKEERAKLLQFVTGTSKVPLNGFKELEGMNGFSRFNIHRDYGNKDRLPSSHTCFNRESRSPFLHTLTQPLTFRLQSLISPNTRAMKLSDSRCTLP
jgi:E3 ubiquitin-protein ligase HUWE1